ncbi:MAG: glutamine amidotransferase [Actinobacteria bacterium]|jgi:uncharacterized membrane protein|nr:glutamine amidotransferase [Actinomycetota bacterium]
MSAGLRVLVVGESWIKHTIHMKGFDQFHNTSYEEGAGVFLAALDASGFDVTYVRAHEVSSRFPTTMAELDAYDVVVVSDVGANTFLLCDETFLRSERTVNRLELLADYVRAGGGLVMVGGYLTFTGIDGKGRYAMSPLADVLPCTLMPTDDRVEKPEGVTPSFDDLSHPLLAAAPGPWPDLLGYNRMTPKPGTDVVARVGDDPLVVLGQVESGRSAVFTSDLAPHWAPPEFLEWPGYRPLWDALLTWAAGKS